MVMDNLLYIFSLIVSLFSVFIIFTRYGFKESLFSPINLFVFSQLLTLIFQVPVVFSKELYLSLQASYFVDFLNDPNFYYYQSINFISYAFFNVFFFIFLIFLKYSPLKFTSSYYLRLSKVEIFLPILFVTFWTFSALKNIGFSFSQEKILELRYNLEHGINALFHKLTMIFIVSNLTTLILLPKKSAYLKFLFALLLLVFILYGIIIGARGFIIFSLLFFSFIKFNRLSFDLILRRLHQGYINKVFLAGAAIISIIFSFYYYYSISIRGYVGNFLSIVSQRLDYLIASYTALKELKPSLHLENLIYPLVSYIPRDLWTSKPFPISAQLTYIIFGYDERWSANFGVVGESLYVLPVVWLVISAGAASLSLKLLQNFIYRKVKSIYDLGLISMLYIYPMGVVMGGILTPTSGDLLFMGTLLIILSYLRRRKILI
jgi:hypothetical protein